MSSEKPDIVNTGDGKSETSLEQPSSLQPDMQAIAPTNNVVTAIENTGKLFPESRLTEKNRGN